MEVIRQFGENEKGKKKTRSEMNEQWAAPRAPLRIEKNQCEMFSAVPDSVIFKKRTQKK